MPVYPCNRSTYGRRPTNHATMPNVAFTRWDPLRDLLALHEQIGQLVGTDAPGWTPPVDLYETAGAFVLTAELPGLAREQIEIHAEESRVVDPRRARRRASVSLRAVSIASSAATAGSRARSCCPSRSTSKACQRRSEGRPADGHDPQGGPIAARAASTSADSSRQSRCHGDADACTPSSSSCSSSPASSPAWWSPAACARRPIRRRRAAVGSRTEPAADSAPRRPAPSSAAAVVAVTGGGPDFTRVAGQAVKGVANISSLQVVRTPNSPVRERSVLPLLLRRRRHVRLARPPLAEPRARASSSRPTATSSPTTTSSARTCARSPSRCADKREMHGQGHRHRSGDRHRAAEDRRDRPAGRPVGRLDAAAGRRMGAGHRQPVPAESDRHGGHRQRHRPRERRLRRLRGLHPDRRGHQPGQLGRRADQHAAASSSASTPASSARAAATRASASPCRATSRSTSSTI